MVASEVKLVNRGVDEGLERGDLVDEDKGCQDLA